MSRYFFDTDDGKRQIRDETGIELAHLDDIVRAARDLLHDLGHTVTVRDERGAVVYRGSATLRVEFD